MSGRSGMLVTGGAGYIGSHVVMALAESGFNVVVLDDLSSGHGWAVENSHLIVGDIGDQRLVTELLYKHDIRTVIHLAASTVVAESVADPIKYYMNNTVGTANLLRCCQELAVSEFVFSSSAAVYGCPEHGRCSEKDILRPINPYGWSKLMSEQMLCDLSAASPMRHVVLRYFNVAGADDDGNISQTSSKATHITKIACEAAVGIRDSLEVFGTDYATADGTCVRDFIRVSDLSDAHVATIAYLRSGGSSQTLNCGYGHGYSVLEIIKAIEHVSGSPLTVLESDRRVGDPPELVADTTRIESVLDWPPRFDDLTIIAESAFNWEHKLREFRNVQHNANNNRRSTPGLQG